MVKRDVIVSAASYLTPEGFGNDQQGARHWPEQEMKPSGMDLARVSWSSVCTSTCSRFGRMDLLSRLGLMAVELLGINFEELPDEERNEVGVALLTPSGSISADIAFLQNISPSTFVYTLPSSVIGEVCIRHRLRGPVLCLTSNSVDGHSIIDEAAEYIRQKEAHAMICLACEARSAAASEVLDLGLDKGKGFCWDVYAIYVTQKEADSESAEKTIGAGIDIRRECLAFCNSNK